MFLSILSLVFLAIFPVLEMLKFWSVNYICQVCKLYFYFDMSEILDNVYIWVFSINSECVLLLALVKYMLCSHFSQNCIFCTFWRLKILALWRKIVENLFILVYLFCPKSGAIYFTKIFITQEWLVVESWPTPRWITFLMLHRLVYNLRCHFN